MARLLSLFILLCLLTAGSGACRTWHVAPDGSGDAVTVQRGVNLASPGDTVLVHPGEYEENIGIGKEDLTLMSSDGPSATVLRSFLDGYIVHAYIQSGHIEGFTFQGVPGIDGPGIVLTRESAVLSASIVGNVFSDIEAYEGAGVSLYYGARAEIRGNLFQNCKGWDAGGGVVLQEGSWARIEGNTFTGNYAKVGGAVCCSQSSTCEIVGNTMDGNEALQNGGGIFLHECPSGLVEDNFVKDNTCGLTGGGIYVYEGTYEVRRNVLWGNTARDGGGLGQSLGASLTCENNTFYGNTAAVDGASARLGGDVPTTFVNCILANSTGASAVDCIRDPLPLVDCNVFWNNSENYTGCSPGPHDIVACPSFCFADFGDFRLCSDSPCLPVNHPHGGICGLIGAKDEGCTCGPTSAEPTTWGRIKATYR